MKSTKDLIFQGIFDGMEQAIYISDPKTYEILYVNDMLKDLFGADIMGKTCYKIFQGFDAPCPFCTNDKLFGEIPESPYAWDFHNKKIDRWFHIIDQAIDWEEGKKVRFEMAEDITERKSIELNLEESKSQLDQILTSMKDTVFVISEDYKVLFKNDTAHDYFGDELLGAKCYKVIKNLQEPCERCPIKTFSKSDLCQVRFEQKVKSKAKEDTFYYDIVSTPIKNYQGQKAILEMIRDNTENVILRKNIEANNRKIEILNQIILKGNKAENLKQLYSIFLTSTLELMNFDGGGVYLLEENSQDLILMHAEHLPGDFIDNVKVKKKNESFYTEDLISGKPLFTENYITVRPEVTEKWGFRATAIIPLFSGNSFIGAFNITTRKQDIIKKEDKELLSLIGKEMGNLISRFQAEDHLINAEKKFRKLVEGIDEAIYRMSLETGEYDYMSSAAIEVFGYSSEDFLNKPKLIQTIIHPDFLDYFSEKWQDLQKGMIDPLYEYKIIDKNKKERWIIQSNTGIKNSKGELIAIEGICRDITEDKINRENLRKQKEWLNQTLSSIGDAVIATDADSNITLMNPVAEKLTGWRMEEVKEKKINEIFKIFNEITGEKAENPVERVLKEGKVVGLANHTILVSKKGEKRNISDSGAPIKNIDGKIIGVVLVFRDVTEEYKMRKKVENSEQLSKKMAEELEIIIDNIPGLVFYKDTENNYIRVNQYVADAHKVNKGELEGKNLFEIYSEGQAQAYWDDDKKVIESGKPKLNFIEPWETEEGKRWVSTSKIPYVDENGETKGIIGVSLDVTERIQNQKKIEKHNRLLDSINQIFQKAITTDSLADLAMTCLEVAQIMTGSKFGFIGKINEQEKFDTIALTNPGWEACNMPRSKATKLIKDMEIRGLWGEVIKTERPVISNPLNHHKSSVGVPEGHPELKSFIGTPLIGEDKIFGMMALANADDGYDEDSIKALTSLSSTIMESLTKKRLEGELEQYKSHLETLVSERTAELRERIKELDCINGINNILQKKELSMDEFIRDAIELIPPAFKYPEATCARIIAKQKIYETAHFKETKWKLTSDVSMKGKPIGSLEVFYTEEKPAADIGPFLKEEQDLLNNIIISLTNINQRKLAERRVRETIEELKRSNSELEQFAYVASHDLQEPLRMVASFTQLLQRRYSDKLDKDANDFIDFAVDGATRMQGLINDLLVFSRVGTRGKPFKETDMNVILKSVKSNLKHKIDETGAIITSEPLPVIIADDNQMMQLFQNLISNAIKFQEESEAPIIKIRGEVRKDDWFFSIQDNGIGIEPKYFDRIFIIFQRLHKKSDYSGTGIGLAVCKKIIQRHGGKIWVESEKGKGSTFYFTIPRNSI